MLPLWVYMMRLHRSLKGSNSKKKKKKNTFSSLFKPSLLFFFFPPYLDDAKKRGGCDVVDTKAGDVLVVVTVLAEVSASNR